MELSDVIVIVIIILLLLLMKVCVSNFLGFVSLLVDMIDNTLY